MSGRRFPLYGSTSREHDIVMVRRLVFDISTSALRVHAAGGIARVESELARRAHQCWKGRVAFTCFSAEERRFFPVDSESATCVLTEPRSRGRLQLETRAIDPFRHPRRFLARKLAELLPQDDPRSLLQQVGERVFGVVGRDQYLWYRRARQIRQSEFRFEPDDVLVSAGPDWIHGQVHFIPALKQKIGFKYLPVCYDIIPLQYPQFCPQSHVELFRRHFDAVIASADRLMCISNTVRRDVQAHRPGLSTAIDFFHLGMDYSTSGKSAPLPERLVGRPYVLFVASIDPRKNHRLAFEVWRQLLDERRIPSHATLVFVGGVASECQPLLDEIAGCEIMKDRFIHFSGSGDDLLHTLYENCLISILPTHYEGFGLPLWESLNHGKYCIASNSGSLPEIAPAFAKLLDPYDRAGWADEIADLINDSSRRQSLEAAIKREWRAQTWDEAAETFYRKIALAVPSGPA
jgi:glycosyltransferase involved in cell wall biosynthesis